MPRRQPSLPLPSKKPKWFIHQWWVENVWKPSWTRLVTYLYGVPAAIVALGQQIGNWASNETIKDLVGQLHVPSWVPQALVLIAIIHFMAHGRGDNDA